MIIIRTFPAAGRKGTPGGKQGATCRFPGPRLATRTKASLSAAAADLKSMGCASKRKIFRGVRYPVVRGQVRRFLLTESLIPLEFIGAVYRALRSQFTFLGNAPLKPRKQSSSCVRQTFQLPISFRDASASYSQSELGAHGNARNPFGEIRNVEC